MSFIDIHTNNMSRQLRNASTYLDNWVYVPGNTITGDWKKPMAFRSLEEFQKTCGTESPVNSLTYEYVAGLLSAGLPVLFRRIAYQNQDSVTDALIERFEEGNLDDIDGNGTALPAPVGVRRAKYYSIPAGTDTKLFKVVEKYGGSFGNRERLSGGEDIDNDLIRDEIPQSLEFIKDKVLYQPKFVTMGGYTEKDTTSSNSVGKAVLQFTKERQDCRAVLDLPLGIEPTEQQGKASGYSYQQGSDDELIPSGSMCAPWQYMQVGNKQLWMPPSYAYLTVVGSDLSKGKPAFTPKAGISSGRVTNIIRPEFEIGSTLAEEWQKDGLTNINPIMKLQSGSYVIAGNSTLLQTSTDGNELNAFSESSADLTIIEIRRFVYNLATELQYQYNGVEAFETFSLRTAKFLNTMASEGAVTDYDIINISTDEDPRTLKVQLDVYLTPTIKKIEIYLNVAYGSIEVSTGGVK